MEKNLVFENLPKPGAEILFTFSAQSAGSGKDEGRDPPVSRAKSRHSESGRQDLKATPNPCPRPVFRGLRWVYKGIGRTEARVAAA
jgi:hypothetical protein